MRKKSLLACVAILSILAAPARAEDPLRHGQSALFLSRLLAAAPLSIAGGSVAPGVPPQRGLPHIPHFGFSRAATGHADGIYFSPAAGVEFTARPALGNGLEGRVGITLRF